MEPYNPKPGFWRPSGRKAHKAVRDTAETLLSVQEYEPPRKCRVHPESLDAGQLVREQAFSAGYAARRDGGGRTSSVWHEKPREERTTREDAALAAFELGWDTAAQSSSP